MSCDLLKDNNQFNEVFKKLSSLETDDNMEDLEDFFVTINKVLAIFNLQLVIIDINSDSYPFTILSSHATEKAMSLAKHADFGTIKPYYPPKIKTRFLLDE